MSAIEGMRQKLLALGQEHLFSEGDATVTKQQEERFLQELADFEKGYPGGVTAYVNNARRLLETGGSDVVHRINKPPRVPTLIHHAPPTAANATAWSKMESTGLELLKQTAFVLVAGGLGERLGYSGIKLSLPVETASWRSYLEHYCTWIQRLGGPDSHLFIMTSDDTHKATGALLDEHKYFGLNNVHITKQGTVPCIGDLRGRIATAGQYNLLRKPHGHGDVHFLLHQTGLIPELKNKGCKYIVFLQDTNASSVTTVPYSLAVSETDRLTMNFTCVPRMPGEAVGALCCVGCTDGKERVVNIEYNILDKVIQQTAGSGGSECQGDVPLEGSKYSGFPGSINTLLVNFDAYAEVLEKTQGGVPELINPKFIDAAKTTFKSPTRVESLMQDIAWCFSTDTHCVGGTVFEREMYHPVKNSVSDSIVKVKSGLEAHGALTGEAAVYKQHRLRLQGLGVKIENGAPTDALFLPGMTLFPAVSLPPNAFSVSLVRRIFVSPPDVRISPRSTLVLKGPGTVVIHELDLDGALVIDCGKTDSTTKVTVKLLKVHNAGWDVQAVDPMGEDDAEPVVLMRGFAFVKKETVKLEYDDGKEHVIDDKQSKM